MLREPTDAGAQTYRPPGQDDQMSQFLQMLQGINAGVQSNPYVPFRAPEMSGGYSAPALGGQVGVQGTYQSNSFDPSVPGWSLKGSYKRQF